MMSILHYYTGPKERVCAEAEQDKRYERDALGDLKHGLDLIFELKAQLDKLHPIAAETLIRLLSH
jgi:hypothetical protein